MTSADGVGSLGQEPARQVPGSDGTDEAVEADVEVVADDDRAVVELAPSSSEVEPEHPATATIAKIVAAVANQRAGRMLPA
ncbi:hypothetical protein [Gordonia bronchialis]|uniref:hypothetical protein n=1 Tax=Gordonia bronchialis TaxID=2054 RepID=UPI00227172D0|nr:hypothetical protein [Gordonia bronchialis]